MNVKGIKKYCLPVFLTFACVLSSCSQSNSNNGNNTQQKEEKPKIDGTWKVKGFSDTMDQVINGQIGNKKVAETLKNCFNDIDMTLTVKDKDVTLHYTFDTTKLYEEEYNLLYKNKCRSFENLVKENTTIFKEACKPLKYTLVTREGNKIDYTLNNGVDDTEKNTISFQETPPIDGFYIIGVKKANAGLEPITFNYKFENNELVLTITETSFRTKKEQTVDIRFTKE